jgi:hypothetical protein
MKIVVIGGSGRVGGDVVRRLASDGHEAVAASPAAGVHAITGESLAEVMAGAEVVVAVSNAPVWDVIGDPYPRYFGTELHGGELTPGDGARIGAIHFETSFATHPQGARR